MPVHNHSALVEFLLSCDESWCQVMGYFNPYLDPFENHLQGDVPVYDGDCYDRYPHHRFVYDKLWVAASQELPSGTVEDLLQRPEMAHYPLFIRPRWGHKTSGSKHCREVASSDDLPALTVARAHELMWSEFIPGREGMTDFVLTSGRVVYQMTHVYSDEQKGFAEVWKYTSPDNKPPPVAASWVEANLAGFTGIVNVQYRGDKIIEVGLRPARTGAYFAATDNAALLRNVSGVLSEGFWNFETTGSMRYRSYYSFKCYTEAPIVFVWPQHVLDFIMRRLTTRPFYEYYPEPTGRRGMMFLQFMHDDLKEGKKAIAYLEKLFNYTQWSFVALAAVLAAALTFDWTCKWYLVSTVLALYATQLLNPISIPVRFNQAKAAQAET
jgi:hypothetical protein